MALSIILTHLSFIHLAASSLSSSSSSLLVLLPLLPVFNTVLDSKEHAKNNFVKIFVVLRRKHYQTRGKKMINHMIKGKGGRKTNAKLIGPHL